MKSTGIIRNIDGLGRIVIPKELRRTLGIKEHDPLEIFTTDVGIEIRPYHAGCICCGESNALSEVDGIRICSVCINKFANGGDLV